MENHDKLNQFPALRRWKVDELRKMTYTIIIIILGFMVMILIIRKIIMMMMKIMNIKYQLTKQPQGRRIEVGG